VEQSDGALRGSPRWRTEAAGRPRLIGEDQVSEVFSVREAFIDSTEQPSGGELAGVVVCSGELLVAWVFPAVYDSAAYGIDVAELPGDLARAERAVGEVERAVYLEPIGQVSLPGDSIVRQQQRLKGDREVEQGVHGVGPSCPRGETAQRDVMRILWAAAVILLKAASCDEKSAQVIGLKASPASADARQLDRCSICRPAAKVGRVASWP
jgi:hypothetical protein